ncbi:hypothetical protein D5S18_16580 [Nocardia panacis]|uniref:Alpha/beta-hydrolase catalytic domain-containing protein n=1 Tax=Nocardia panacis TaxID=2340916 RepID=A0A3A4KPP8_9NOCA|nr:alpha/beta-hydrolase family protein [Nocardia panacis]RJO75010.1 hypothetical protein D5S18_16580 [Nocardia panacis]
MRKNTLPRVGTTVAIGIGTLVSLAPGLLPRTPGAQAVLTGLLAIIALAIAGLVRFVLRRVDIDVDTRLHRWRIPALLVTAPLVLAAIALAQHWQNTLRSAMGVARIGPEHWVRWGVGSALIIVAVLALARGIGWALRRLGWLRGTAVSVVAGSMLSLVGIPSVAEWRRETYAAANAQIDPAVTQPISENRSGSADSMVSWPSLGAEGRKFVTTERVVAPRDPGQVRVYVGLDSARDLNSRVELAIGELERTGGLTRSHLVVVVPTGSGWIDANAVEGLQRRFGDDAALVGLQYSYAPSWVTFLFGRQDAIRSARALFTAVERKIATMAHKPELYVYGQSLGALGGSAIFADEADQANRTCAVLWAGAPANAAHRGPRATVLANASDPVVRWSPGLLWHAPDLTGVRADAPIPGWLPIVGFLQTTADLLGALDAPSGHGHRYGDDQGTALGACRLAPQ